MRIQVKHILIGVIAALVIAIAAQGGLALLQLRAVNANTLALARDWMPSVRELGELKYKTARLRLVDARYVMALEDVEVLAKVSADRIAGVDAIIARYDPLISDAQERSLWDAFRRNWSDYMALRHSLLAAAQAGDQKRMADLFSSSRKPFDAGMRALEQAADLNVKGGEQADADAASTYGRALWLTGLLCGLALACALAGITFVLGGVTRPLDRLIARMRMLAAGDADTEVPYLARRNEIGAIAAAVETSRDNLIRTRQMEADTAQARLAAEEQRRAGMREMAEAFEQAVGSIVGMVSSSATELQATAQTMTVTATQTAAQSTSVAAAAEEAASNVALRSLSHETCIALNQIPPSASSYRPAA